MTDKLSNDIISEVTLIDRVKHAAQRLIRVEAPINNTMRVNDIFTSDVIERLFKSGATPCDNDPLIIAGRCSGFDNTDLLIQSSEIVTATLQMQGGGLMYLIIVMDRSPRLVINLLLIRLIMIFL